MNEPKVLGVGMGNFFLRANSGPPIRHEKKLKESATKWSKDKTDISMILFGYSFLCYCSGR